MACLAVVAGAAGIGITVLGTAEAPVKSGHDAAPAV